MSDAMTDKKTERVQFEAWTRGELGLSPTWLECTATAYTTRSVEDLWRCWQARAALTPETDTEATAAQDEPPFPELPVEARRFIARDGSITFTNGPRGDGAALCLVVTAEHIMSAAIDAAIAHARAARPEAAAAVVPDARGKPASLEQDIASALNCHGAENGSNTPDFILAHMLREVLHAFDSAVVRREEWYGRTAEFGPSHPAPSDAREQALGDAPVAWITFDGNGAKTLSWTFPESAAGAVALFDSTQVDRALTSATPNGGKGETT